MTEEREVLKRAMSVLVVFMDAGIREDVAYELAPCTDEEFIKKYLEYDPGFKEIYEEVIAYEKERMC